MSKMAKITAALVACGFGVERACFHAEKLSKELSVGNPPTSTPKRVPSAGLCVEQTAEEQVIAYATRRNGNVFSLASLALAMPGTNRNYISTILTTLVRDGRLNRTGRGEYVLNRKK